MRLTNLLGLPDALVRAVANDDYTRGDAHYSVTELVSPAQLVTLRRQYGDALTEDVSERIWSLFGQCAHEILHRANVDALTELRLSMDVDGVRVSGRFDRLALFPDGLLSDFKVTSAWSLVARESDGTVGLKPEWEQQLNLYRLLVEAHGGTVDRMEIIALLRDWSRMRAKASATYPQLQVAVVPVPVWDRERAWTYLRERVALHQAARGGDVPPCTPVEQWRRPDQWAHMRAGRKSAVRLYATEAEAGNSVSVDPGTRGKAYVQYRPGVAIRCAEYCVARSICQQRAREGTPLEGEVSEPEVNESAA